MIKLSRRRVDWKDDILIDMTPMIDVTFILLIFFILTANIAQHVYPVKLPQSDSSFHRHLKDNTPIKVTLFEDGTFAIDKTKYYSIKKVKHEILRNASESKKIIIIPDAKTHSGDLISFLTFLEGNNITNVDILVEDGK